MDEMSPGKKEERAGIWGRKSQETLGCVFLQVILRSRGIWQDEISHSLLSARGLFLLFPIFMLSPSSTQQQQLHPQSPKPVGTIFRPNNKGEVLLLASREREGGEKFAHGHKKLLTFN